MITFNNNSVFIDGKETTDPKAIGEYILKANNKTQRAYIDFISDQKKLLEIIGCFDEMQKMKVWIYEHWDRTDKPCLPSAALPFTVGHRLNRLLADLITFVKKDALK